MRLLLETSIVTIGIITSTMAFANKTHDAVYKMQESRRSALFGMLLKDSGIRCEQVTKTFFQGLAPSGTAIWNVACNNDIAYAISISDDTAGSTKILECSALKTSTPCFKKP